MDDILITRLAKAVAPPSVSPLLDEARRTLQYLKDQLVAAQAGGPLDPQVIDEMVTFIDEGVKG